MGRFRQFERDNHLLTRFEGPLVGLVKLRPIVEMKCVVGRDIVNVHFWLPFVGSLCVMMTVRRLKKEELNH
jgi:hypothetical protein